MIRIGFIGTGSFARLHAEVLKEQGVNIVACFGTNQEKTHQFAQDFGCKIYDEPCKVISEKIIDALYIVIPPFAHDGKIELTAIEKNIPFFCEKPIGLNLKICQKISDQIQKTNLITSVGYLLRYEKLFEEARSIIDRNKISTVRICSYSYMPHVHWWRKTKLSGGMMVESGTHYIDLLRYLFGEIVNVAAVTSQGLATNHIANCDLYDSMEAILKFKSGIIGSIGITHLLNKIQARTDTFEIYGQDFAMKIDLYKLRQQNEARAMFKEGDDDTWQIVINHTSKKILLERQAKAFLNATVQDNTSLIRSNYADALQTLKVTLAMDKCAQAKKFACL